MPRLRVVNLQVLVGARPDRRSARSSSSTPSSTCRRSLGVDPVILALVIAPIATELPEKFNSVIWVRQGKDTLAMGNITGAMVFQSTIPTVVALLFAADAWHFSDGQPAGLRSRPAIAFLSSAAIFIPMARSGRLLGRRLLVGGGFYVVYLAIVGASLPGVVLSADRGLDQSPTGAVRSPVLSSGDRRHLAARPRRAVAALAADPAQERPHADPEVEPGRAAATDAAPAADPHAGVRAARPRRRHRLLRGRASSRCATPRSAS